ncbi:MAG: hydantoinase/oxoprolinase family protein [Candidatus Altiarchaeota archaeon]
MVVRILGIDVGGLTLKFAEVKVGEKGFEVEDVENTTFLPNMLESKIKRFLGGRDDFAAVGVASSGEIVSTIFPRLSDGIIFFQKVFEEEFTCPVFWINHDSTLTTNEQASSHPYDVAAANWRAQSLLAARKVEGDFLHIDTGSSSTDITAVINGAANTSGRLDYQRLATGELVYTGGIFTHPACATGSVKLKGRKTMLCSEPYALVADAHLIAGNISEGEHAGFLGAGSYADAALAYTRIAHMVYADDHLLTREEIADIARQICAAQVSQIADGIRKVCKKKFRNKPQAVVSGSAADYLAAPAAAEAGLKDILYLEDLVGKKASIAAPAVGTAMLAGEKIFRDSLNP